MSDVTPQPPKVPEPNWWQRMFTAILPQFITYSRKGLVWFTSLGASGILELCKQFGPVVGWTDAQMLQWNNRMLLVQGVLLLVAKFWTDQIAKEDSALKTGLPAPVVVPIVQGLPPPAPPRGEGD